MMKRLAYLHPFILAAIASVITYVSLKNLDIYKYIPPAAILSPLVWGLVICLFFMGSLFFFTRNLNATALISTIFILGLLHFWYIFLAVIAITLLFAFVSWFVRRKITLADINLGLSFISIVLSIFYLVLLGRIIAAQPAVEVLAHSADPLSSGKKATPIPVYTGSLQDITSHDTVTLSSVGKPDIYYIILDMYERPDALQKLFGYDDSAFVSSLTQRGFIVTPQSRSNYPRTILSLSSSMNMQYLDDISSAMGDSYLWWPIMDTIHHSLVRLFLEHQGYKTVFVASGIDFTNISDGSYYLKPFPIMLLDYESTFVDVTNLHYLGNLWHEVPSGTLEDQRRTILHGFSAVTSSVTIRGPKFVFSHIVSPHPPFVFAADGSFTGSTIEHPEVGTPGYSVILAQYRQAYLDQLTYINTATMQMVDAILANSKTPPVIIIQADHGSDVYWDGDHLADACLFERYSILNAYYLPGVDPTTIPADVSPVNTFRMVFDIYFGLNLPLLPNKSYYSVSQHLYQFQDVTALTNNTCSLTLASSH